MGVFRSGIAFLAVLSFAAQSGKNRTAAERVEDVHLEAVHQTRVDWMRDRVVYPPLGIYHDYRAIIFDRPEDFPASPADRKRILEAARQDAIDAFLYAKADASQSESWSGIRDGVLFVPGDASKGELCFPAQKCDVRFAIAGAGAIPDGVSGMEIGGGQSGDRELSDYFGKGSKSRRFFKRMAAKHKEYADEVLGAVTEPPAYLSRWDVEIEKQPFTGIVAYDAQRDRLFQQAGIDDAAAMLRLASAHILALDLNQEEILSSLRAGHVYVAHDWLCDPAGFSFVAMNSLGVFEIGDPVPLIANTKFAARFPVPATVRLVHKGQVVAQNNGPLFEFTPSEPGAYRLEAWLNLDGEERPWIFANPMYLYRPDPGAFTLPPASLAGGVEAFGDIPYVKEAEESDEHRLDLYIPAGKKGFPVLMFLHGGTGPLGDRRAYTYIGNRFAEAGIGVVIPSYRPAPAHDPPAQIEDAAAAFAWVQKYISGYGGEPRRIFVAGHSMGGQLAALLALNSKYLAGYGLKPADIRGVIGISGLYRSRNAPSAGGAAHVDWPIEHVSNAAPRFLLAYCQWDYLGLPQQARDLDAALRRSFVGSKLMLLKGENHISEIIHLAKEDDPLAQAIIGFVRSDAPQ